MKRTVISLLGILMVGLFAVVMAQTGSSEYTDPGSTGDSGSPVSITGTIVSATGDKLVIDADSGTRMTFTVDSSSSLPGSLIAGNVVTVDYNTLEGGKNHVSKVILVSSGAPGGASTEAQDDQLPSTASFLPLVALIGAITLGGALGVRAYMRFAA